MERAEATPAPDLSGSQAIAGILIGFLSDRIDRRKSLLAGAIVLFTLFSALSGIVGGLASLLLFRAVMGAAEGAALPLSQPSDGAPP